MHFLTTLLTFILPLILHLASSNPTPAVEHHPKIPSRYYLRTRTHSGGSPSKNNLYVESYHTGAGLNDVVLVSEKPQYTIGFLNKTQQQFELGSGIPWGFYMAGDANYAGWELVELNVGYGDMGFSINRSGLQWNTTYYGFGGWLACDWYHGLPQLFYRIAFYNDTIPCSCALVDLLPVAV